MADIVFSTATIVQPYLSKDGSPRIKYFEESTAVSTALIAYGNVVTLDEAQATAAHRIVRASTAAGHPLLSTSFVGVAADGSTGVKTISTVAGSTNPTLAVYAADGDTEFLFPFKGTVASSLVGHALALGWDSTNNHHYVIANSTAGDRTVWITGIQAGTAGDTNGFLVGQFTSTACAPAVRSR